MVFEWFPTFEVFPFVLCAVVFGFLLFATVLLIIKGKEFLKLLKKKGCIK